MNQSELVRPLFPARKSGLERLLRMAIFTDRTFGGCLLIEPFASKSSGEGIVANCH
jgi:hypothetical protein